MKEETPGRLLDRYLKGECTPEEQRRLEQWLDERSAAGTHDTTSFNRDEVQQRLKAKIDRQLAARPLVYMSRVFRIAAAVIVILLGTFIVFKSTETGNATYATTRAGRGQRLRLTLSDGSVVTLNAGSSLRYPQVFKGNSRNVTLLEGEAFFEIQPRERCPFIVGTANTITTVLGTAFNVQAYTDAKEVKITVVSGKVAVKESHGAEAMVVLPDEQAALSPAGIQKKQVSATDNTGWLQGKLQFRNESLEKVALILENNYDVTITFSKEATRHIRFTATFSTNDPLDKILFAITKANKLSYSMKDKIISL
ncbi:FecR family protein [Chitinophaga eiseniae]|uniref:DUF4974 domain-containing protein n=1 Tax=Chitinophaga eiseniae TaxID=634771 RepID=A0A847SNY4_9BACT|nr:FecR domain-containing protein [Chitinophaga eiseniae]NLR80617.1 DUF4974 domain-containing protein [Chitinophaga eiseniae]